MVFKLGEADSADEGIPAFTSEQRANDWLAGSRFENDYEVAKLEDVPFMFWCMDVYRGGIEHLILDPDRDEQDAGQGQDTIDLGGHLAWSANQLMNARRNAA
jgi:hypothetical protein